MEPALSSHPILAEHDAETIVVYQAYSWSIAGPALAAGRFVPPFQPDRLTWIKPSFLWMVHRSDWGRAPGQEHVLAIRLPRARWDRLLDEGVQTTPDGGDKAAWRRRLERSSVRIQWDPDRDLWGRRLEQRAIQVGIGPPLAAAYASWPVQIVDRTERIHHIEALRDSGRLDEAHRLLPPQQVYPTSGGTGSGSAHGRSPGRRR